MIKKDRSRTKRLSRNGIQRQKIFKSINTGLMMAMEDKRAEGKGRGGMRAEREEEIRSGIRPAWLHEATKFIPISIKTFFKG
jgi:hypothetical protein